MDSFKTFAMRLLRAMFAGLKLAILTAFVVGLVTFLGAHSLFGIVFITAGMIATVVAYTVVSFIVGSLAKFFGLTNRKMTLVNLGNLTGK